MADHRGVMIDSLEFRTFHVCWKMVTPLIAGVSVRLAIVGMDGKASSTGASQWLQRFKTLFSWLVSCECKEPLIKS